MLTGTLVTIAGFVPVGEGRSRDFVGALLELGDHGLYSDHGALIIGLGLLVDDGPGIVVAIAIPMVLAVTFVVMKLTGVSLQRISLGAGTTASQPSDSPSQ
jgi:hypothetical protein